MNKLSFSKFILISLDGLSLLLPLAMVFLCLTYYGVSEHFVSQEQFSDYFLIHIIISLTASMWFWLRLRHYTYRKPLWFELKEILRTLLIFFVIELAIIALSKLYVSRTFWVSVWGIIFVLMPTVRIVAKKILINIGLFVKDTVIIGDGENAQDVYEAIKWETYLGFKVNLFVSTKTTEKKYVKNIPIIPHNPELLLELTEKNTTQIILAVDNENIGLQEFWLRFLMKNNYRAISVIPNLRGLPVYGTDMAFLFSHDLILLRLNNNLAKLSSRMIKRTMDILGSLALIFILSPLLLTLYLLVKKDGGNAIYKHKRIGRKNKFFDCYKFRSMIINSEQVLGELLATNSEAKQEWEKDFKLKDDPRITPVGRFLRKTSLDELPQLFNVLKGEMSLVGPRPIVQEEIERYDSDYDYYFMAKPGMTGLWQVSGRNNVDYETRVYFDSWYAKNWSVWNDMVILFKTIKVVLNKNGAY